MSKKLKKYGAILLIHIILKTCAKKIMKNKITVTTKTIKIDLSNSRIKEIMNQWVNMKWTIKEVQIIMNNLSFE